MAFVHKKRAVHFVGIGGIAMSYLAQWFRERGWAVSGSDATRSVVTDDLHKRGIRIHIGHKRSNLSSFRSPDLVIRTKAIPSANPEIREAERRKVLIHTNPEIVGWLTRTHTTIAVAGAHGKSTTSALAGLMLRKAGVDPTIFIGTRLKELGNNNFRSGKSDYLVLEADEYGRSFLEYSPSHAIVTNIDEEHLDTYRDLADIKRTFLSFLGRTFPSGTLVLNRDDKNIFSLRARIAKIAHRRSLRILWYSLRDSDARVVRRAMKLPGDHNVSNALGVLRLARILGIPRKTALASIGAYRGSWRRMEYRGELRIENCKLKIFDDYAHHPTEIKATLKAFREKFPDRILVCVFQPHQTERLAKLFSRFRTSFSDADITLIAPVYRVKGRDAGRGRTSEDLVRAVQKENPQKRIFYLEHLRRLRRSLATLLSPGMSRIKRKRSKNGVVLVMMGAGDIVDYTPLLLSGN